MKIFDWIKEKFKILFKASKTIGYVQLYFKIVGDKEVYHVAFNGDFEKPLTWFRLHSIKRSMRKAYEKFDKIYSVDFCCKEEYEKMCDGNRNENEVRFNWGNIY